jgi:hypothetical protein
MKGSSSIHRQATLQSNKMQLEYKVLPLAYSDLEELETYLNAMGSKGWRLAAIKDNLYIFRRKTRHSKVTELGYTEEEVRNLLDTQRGNCYVAVLIKARNEDFAKAASTAPEPGGLNGWVKKKEYEKETQGPIKTEEKS